MNKEIAALIKQADRAIKREDFDALMDFYTDDAVLVVKPGTNAHGKKEIKAAFIAIAKYFHNTLTPTQGSMCMLESGDTVLVLSQTLLKADKADTAFSMDRRATYVFKKDSGGKWLCAIDNSYGTALLD